MAQEEVNIIQSILSLGLPGILLIICFLLWRALQNAINDHIETLKEIAMVRQKREEVEAFVEATKTQPSRHEITGGSGI